MTDAAELVADAITDAVTAAGIGTVDVSAFLSPTDAPSRPRVLIGSQSIDPPSVACPGGRLYTLRVWVITPLTAPGAADAAVDELVDVVLDGIDAARLVWSDVTRGVWQDQFPAYVLSVEVPE